MRIQNQERPVLQLQEVKYVILFTLDTSGSMSGSRWNSVCSSVRNIVEHLNQHDLVAGLTFSDKADIVKPNREQVKRLKQQEEEDDDDARVP